jgi:hypothetical protein
MSIERSTIAIAVLLALSGAAHALPDPTPDANAEVVFLKTNCGNPPLDNCFESLNQSTGLIAWIDVTRRPRATSPLAVHIGPGEFVNNGPPALTAFGLTCYPSDPNGFHGHTKFLGSLDENGEIATIFRQAGNGNTSSALWVIGGCERLEFHDMVFKGSRYGVAWYHGGTSVWVNVEITATGGVGGTFAGTAFGWWEESLFCLEPGTHKFYDSRVSVPSTGHNTIAFYAPCDKNFYYGGTIEALGTAQTTGSANLIAILASGNGSVETYGTTVQSLSAQATNGGFDGTVADGVTAVVLGRNDSGGDNPGGAFEAYGGEVIASAQTTAGQSAIGVDVGPGGTAEGAPITVAPGTSGGFAITTRYEQAAPPVLILPVAEEE